MHRLALGGGAVGPMWRSLGHVGGCGTLVEECRAMGRNVEPMWSSVGGYMEERGAMLSNLGPVWWNEGPMWLNKGPFRGLLSLRGGLWTL